MNFFKKDLENIARSAGKGRGLVGNVTSAISKYAASSVLVSQAAELSTYPFVQGYFGRGVKPSIATGPLTVSMVTAILPGGLASLGASVIHPELAKPVVKLNQSTISWLKSWVKQTNARNPNRLAPQAQNFTGPPPRPANAYGNRDPRRLIQKTVRAIENRIDTLYRDDPQSASMLKALYLSNRRYLEKDLVREFDQSGQSHVLAFSGMHMSMLYLYLKGALGLLKATGRTATRLGRSGARAIGSFTEKPSDQLIQRQKTLANQVGRILMHNQMGTTAGGYRVKLPYSNPRNMREYLINQQYLSSVDPAVDTESLRGQQSQRALQDVVNRFARSSRSVGGGAPVQFRNPRQAASVAAPWDRLYSTGVWQDEPDLQSYLLSVKYDKIKRNIRPLVKHMLANLPADFDASNYDMIVPVPLHRSRRKQRGGYNQAELLAKALAKHTGIPLERELLHRGADTRQAKVNRQYRRQNLQQAFSVRNAERVYGKRALLFDDLITSGTTADVATRKLRQAGASGVSVFALARSDRDYSRGMQTRRVGGAMNDFLGISLLSGRNTPKYPYPASPRTIKQDFDTQLRSLPGYGTIGTPQGEAIIQRNLERARQNTGTRAGRYDYEKLVSSVEKDRQLIQQIEGQRDAALKNFERAVAYYNDSLTQNVSVHFGYTDKAKPQWIGSGTFIAPGQVMTARHVVRAKAGDSHRQPMRGFVRGLDRGRVEFPILGVLYEDMNHDIAVLETVTHAAQQAAEFGRTRDLTEGPIRHVGADLRSPRDPNYDPFSGAKITVYSDYEDPIPIGSRLMYGGGHRTIGGDTKKGMSGGGWFNERGELIGVNSRGGPVRRQGRDTHASIGPDIDKVKYEYDFQKRYGFANAYELTGEPLNYQLMSGLSLRERARALPPRMPAVLAEHVTLNKATYDKIMEQGYLVPHALQESDPVAHMGFPLDRILGDDRYTYFSYGNYLRKDMSRDAYGFAFDPKELVGRYGGGVGKDLWDHYLSLYHSFMQRERFPDNRRVVASKREWDVIRSGDFSAMDANRGKGIFRLPPDRQSAVMQGFMAYAAENPPPQTRRRVWGEKALARLMTQRGQSKSTEILVPGRVPIDAAWKRIEGGRLVDNEARKYYDQQIRLFSGYSDYTKGWKHTVEPRYASEHILRPEFFEQVMQQGYLSGEDGRYGGLLYFSEGAHYRGRTTKDGSSSRYGFLFDPRDLEYALGAVPTFLRARSVLDAAVDDPELNSDHAWFDGKSGHKLRQKFIHPDINRAIVSDQTFYDTYSGGKDRPYVTNALKVMPEEKFGLEAFLKFQRKYNVESEPEIVVPHKVPLALARGVADETGVYWIDPETWGNDPNKWNLFSVEDSELGGREPGSFSPESVRSVILPEDFSLLSGRLPVSVPQSQIDEWDAADDIFYRLVNRAEDTLRMNSEDVIASRLLLSDIESPIRRPLQFSDLTLPLNPEAVAAIRQQLEGKLLPDQFYEPHSVFRRGVYAGHTVEDLDGYLYDNNVAFGSEDVLRVIRGEETKYKDYLERWGRASYADYSETVVRPQEILADLSVKLLEMTMEEQAYHRQVRGLPEEHIELLSGLSEWDRHPNTYYSPLDSKRLMAGPAFDRDTANYSFLLGKIMNARSRDEVNSILELGNRRYNRSGIQFIQGQIGVNRASQLAGQPGFRGRGTVFEGLHLSDRLSRQGSVVVPKRIVSAGPLDLAGVTPELWQPRPGWVGAARTIPPPADTDITYEDVLRHIRSLPQSSRGRQLRLGVETPSREIPKVVVREQLKLMSGLPHYAEHVTSNLERYREIEKSGFIKSRKSLGLPPPAYDDPGRGVIAPLDIMAGDDMFSFFSYGPRYRGGAQDTEFGKFGYVFRPETLIEKYNAQVAEYDLLDGYAEDFVEALSKADPANPALLYDYMAFMEEPDPIIRRLGFAERDAFLQEFEQLVQTRQRQSRLGGGYGLETLRAVDINDPYFENVEIVVPDDIPVSEAVGRIWEGNLQLFSGRSNRDMAKDLIHNLLGETAQQRTRPSARTFGEPLDTLNPDIVQRRLTALRQESLLDLIAGETEDDLFGGINYDIEMLEDQLENLRGLERSVVRLEGISEEGKRVSVGSAFSTEPGTLLTNAHVLMGRLERPVTSMVGQVLGGSKERFPIGEVLGFDTTADLAKVAIPEGVQSVRQLRFSDTLYGDDLDPLEPLLSLGGSLDHTRRQMIETYRPGYLDAVSLLEDDRIATLGMGTLLQGGMSGGPTVGADLNVLGVNVSTDALRSYAVGLGTVEDFLEDIETRGGRIYDKLTNIADIFDPQNFDRIKQSTALRSQSVELLSGRGNVVNRLLQALSGTRRGGTVDTDDGWDEFTEGTEFEDVVEVGEPQKVVLDHDYYEEILVEESVLDPETQKRIDAMFGYPEPQLALPPPRNLQMMYDDAENALWDIKMLAGDAGYVSDADVEKLFEDHFNVKTMFDDYRINEASAMEAGREILRRGIDPEVFGMSLTRWAKYDTGEPQGRFFYSLKDQPYTRLTFDFDETNFIEKFNKLLDSFNVDRQMREIFKEFDLAIDRHGMDYADFDAYGFGETEKFDLYSVGTGTEYLVSSEARSFEGDPERIATYIKDLEEAIENNVRSARPRKVYMAEDAITAVYEMINDSNVHHYRANMESLFLGMTDGKTPFHVFIEEAKDSLDALEDSPLGMVLPDTPFTPIEDPSRQIAPEDVGNFDRQLQNLKSVLEGVTGRIREIHEGGLIPTYEHIKDAKIKRFYEQGGALWDEAIDPDTLAMLQRIDEYNRDPNIHVRVTVPEDDATRSSMDDFPKHWEVAAARILDTAETYEQAQAILGEYGRVFDPESSQVKFTEQGGLPVMYQTDEGLVPHPWETAGGRPRIAAASTVDELVKQLPEDFDLSARPTLLFLRGEKALHGWMEDGFAVVADEIVDRLPSELMSHFKDRLTTAGVSTTKSGIYRYNRTGEFYTKMGSLFQEYQERLGADAGGEDYYELGNIRDRLLQRLEEGISRQESGKYASEGYRERTEAHFAKVPEEFYPRLDFLTGPGEMRLGGVIRDLSVYDTGEWERILQPDSEHTDYLELDEAIKMIESELGFDVEANKEDYERYKRAEERGFYFSPDKLTPEDAAYWQDWNVERVLARDFDKVVEKWSGMDFMTEPFERNNPAGLWNTTGASQKRSMLFLIESVIGLGDRHSILSEMGRSLGDIDTGGMLAPRVVEAALDNAVIQGLKTYFSDAMAEGFDEAQYLAPWEQAEIPARFVKPEGAEIAKAPLIGESAKALTRFGYIRDLGV